MLMDPEGVRAFLENLRMQLLAIPSLIRWMAIIGGGILVLRHAITLWWERREARRLDRTAAPEALPSPDPFAAPGFGSKERDPARRDQDRG